MHCCKQEEHFYTYMKTCLPRLSNVPALNCKKLNSRNVVTAAQCACAWSATSHTMIKQTSFLQLSQQIFYSSSFPVLIGKFPNQSPSTVAFWFPWVFNQNLVFFIYHYETFTGIYLSLPNSDVTFTSRVK